MKFLKPLFLSVSFYLVFSNQITSAQSIAVHPQAEINYLRVPAPLSLSVSSNFIGQKNFGNNLNLQTSSAVNTVTNISPALGNNYNGFSFSIQF